MPYTLSDSNRILLVASALRFGNSILFLILARYDFDLIKAIYLLVVAIIVNQVISSMMGLLESAILLYREYQYAKSRG